jgi:hypothetical protein
MAAFFLPTEFVFFSSLYQHGHLRVLDTCKAKVANLQVAVLVDENVGGFEVTVDNAGGVDVFQTTL